VIEAIVSDFGGVITEPFDTSFTRATEEYGIPIAAFGAAMQQLNEGRAEPLLFGLERGEIAAADFTADMQRALSDMLGRPVDLDGWAPALMRSLGRNQRLLSYYGELRATRGIRLAILTNNIREWQPYWREALEIDALFELVVDSGFEGVRKPEPEIYARVLDRLGLPGRACAFIDDLEINLPPARDAGMHAIHFRDTDQVITELDALVLAA
jgi:putative hydrolase of the HAD superfamily